LTQTTLLNFLNFNPVKYFKMSHTSIAQDFMRRATDIMRSLNETINNESKFSKDNVRKISPFHDSMMSLLGEMAVHIGIQEGEISALKTVPIRTHEQTPEKYEERYICDAISEMADRSARAPNLIFLNVPEGEPNLSPSDRAANDKQQVMQLVDSVESDSSGELIRVHRLGPRRDDGCRPLKVIFRSASVATSILYKKFKLPSTIKVKQDLTEFQRRQLKGLWDEVDRRRNEGETNLTVKFINSTPRIVPVHPKNLTTLQ
jgi:hypothetical protein